ncbi:hypothetical protein ACIA5D_36925 [Actinoplanes sp. NPDC051513]|uniref:hypothetical protein n=1 Tax=Actinoplanes sp. NPDC051513 TaxID=3363908 RepID=UPI0037A07543
MSTTILDDKGDVVLFVDGEGTRWVFRDDVCHGLILSGVSNYMTLSRPGQQFVAAATIKIEGGAYVALWQPSGAVAARHDTAYGLVAKMARRLLVPAACCRGEVL